MASIQAGSSGHRRKAIDSDIPLVPFIDLLLCCVMFLLVTAVWNHLESVPATNPTGNRTEQLDDTREAPRTVLRVTRDGCRIEVVGAEQSDVPNRDGHVDTIALLDRLTIQRQAVREGTITLTADDGVVYAEIMKAMDVARGAGFADLVVADGLAN